MEGKISRSEAPDLGKNLGRRLAILRESRDLSQADLARQARITPSSLSLYEAGEKVPELATLFRILEALTTAWPPWTGPTSSVLHCGSSPDAEPLLPSPTRCGVRSRAWLQRPATR